MKLYEFGKENKDVVVLIHPSLVTWDYENLARKPHPTR